MARRKPRRSLNPAGDLGRFVVNGLAARGYLVRALARSPDWLNDPRRSIDEMVEGGTTRPATLEQVRDGIDAVSPFVGITKQTDGLSSERARRLRRRCYAGNSNAADTSCAICPCRGASRLLQ